MENKQRVVGWEEASDLSGREAATAERWLGALATAVAVMLCCGIGPAHAQQQKPVLNVAPVTLVEPASRSPLPIQVGPQDAGLKNSFVRIRGMPPTAALSEGHSVSPGSWAVPLTALPQLSIVVPVGLQGRWEINVSLVTIDGTVLIETKTALVIGPAQLIAPAQRQLETSSTSVASLGPAVSAPLQNSPEHERLQGFHGKGLELLKQGNIQPARMLFKRAAEGGLAQAALALGGTYDPAELAKLKVVGLQPDVEQARKWYTRAQELGASEAAERLRALAAR